MKTPAYLLVVSAITAWVFAAAPSLAQTDPIAESPALDFSDVELFIKHSEKERKSAATDQCKTLIAQLNTMLASEATLLDGYRNAYEFVFLNNDRSKGMDWEKQYREQLKSDAFVLGLRLHVQYLIATLTKRMGEDETAMLLARKWIDDFPRTSAKFKTLEQCELLSRNKILGNITQSVFLRAHNDALNLKNRRAPTVNSVPGTGMKKSEKPDMAATFKVNTQANILQGIQKWYTGDLMNLPDMHRANVLEYLRAKKDARLFEEWKYNLKLELEVAERSGLNEQREAFMTHRHPWLLWQFGKDLALYNRPREAVDVMVAALKESPRCNDYDSIVAEIMRVIADTRAKSAAPAGMAAPDEAPTEPVAVTPPPKPTPKPAPKPAQPPAPTPTPDKK